MEKIIFPIIIGKSINIEANSNMKKYRSIFDYVIKFLMDNLTFGYYIVIIIFEVVIYLIERNNNYSFIPSLAHVMIIFSVLLIYFYNNFIFNLNNIKFGISKYYYKYAIYKSGSWNEAINININRGDIIKINKNDVITVDILVIYIHNNKQYCFCDETYITESLTLTEKKCLNLNKKYFENLNNINIIGSITRQHDNLYLSIIGENPIKIGEENILKEGSALKECDYIIGIVCTKKQLKEYFNIYNIFKLKSIKKIKFESKIKINMAFIICLSIILCFGVYVFKLINVKTNSFYNSFNNSNNFSLILVIFIQCSYIVSVNIFFILQINNVICSYYINNDVEMYNNKYEKFSEVINLNVITNLGKVTDICINGANTLFSKKFMINKISINEQPYIITKIENNKINFNLQQIKNKINSRVKSENIKFYDNEYNTKIFELFDSNEVACFFLLNISLYYYYQTEDSKKFCVFDFLKQFSFKLKEINKKLLEIMVENKLYKIEVVEYSKKYIIYKYYNLYFKLEIEKKGIIIPESFVLDINIMTVDYLFYLTVLNEDDYNNNVTVNNKILYFSLNYFLKFDLKNIKLLKEIKKSSKIIRYIFIYS